MNQNVVQILRIVKAAYDNVPFDDNSYHEKCARPNSDAELLLCQWRGVDVSHEEEKLEKLTKV